MNEAFGTLVRGGDAVLQEVPWFVVGEDAVRLLRDGTQAFPAMLAAIAAAEREVLLEMYWIGADAVGRALPRRAGERAARPGVRVCVIYDAVGSMSITPAWWRPLFAAGGRGVEFHSISPFDPRFRLDATSRSATTGSCSSSTAWTGFTGGINLADAVAAASRRAGAGGATTSSRCAATPPRSCARSSTGPGAR